MPLLLVHATVLFTERLLVQQSDRFLLRPLFSGRPFDVLFVVMLSVPIVYRFLCENSCCTYSYLCPVNQFFFVNKNLLYSRDYNA